MEDMQNQADDTKKEPNVVEDTNTNATITNEINETDLKTPNKVNTVHPHKLGILNNVTVSLTVEVGRAHIKIRDLLNLTKGSIIELNKSAGEPVDVYVNGKLISIGNVITANGKYCVRLTSMPDNEDIEVRSDDQ